MATPVELHDDGLQSLRRRARGFDQSQIVDTYGHAPPHLLQPAFETLDPVGLSMKLIHVREEVRSHRSAQTLEAFVAYRM